MADLEALRSRGIPYRAIADALGVAIGGTATAIELRQRGMQPIVEVDAVGVDSGGSGATTENLRQRGLGYFCVVDENGLDLITSATIAVLSERGIPGLCAVDVLGIAQGGTATIDQLRARGIGFFCPVDELGTATTVGLAPGPGVPVVAWVTTPTTDTTPDLDIDLPSGNAGGDAHLNAIADDVLEVRDNGVLWFSYTLDAAAVLADTITVTGVAPLSVASHDIDARLTRTGFASSAYSAVATGEITVAATDDDDYSAWLAAA